MTGNDLLVLDKVCKTFAGGRQGFAFNRNARKFQEYIQPTTKPQ